VLRRDVALEMRVGKERCRANRPLLLWNSVGVATSYPIQKKESEQTKEEQGRGNRLFLKRLLHSSPQLANKFIHTDKFLFCPVRVLLNVVSKDRETLSIYIDLIHTQKSLPLLRCHSNPGHRVSLVDDSEGGEILYLAGRGRNNNMGKSETFSDVLFSAFVAHD